MKWIDENPGKLEVLFGAGNAAFSIVGQPFPIGLFVGIVLACIGAVECAKDEVRKQTKHAAREVEQREGDGL